jgi:Bacterial PH domain
MASSVSFRRAWYNGRHPARRRELAGRLQVGPDGIAVKSWRASVSLPWDQVGLIDIRAPKKTQKRVTRGRMLLLGAWASALPKPIPATVLEVATSEGPFWVMIDGHDPESVRGRLAPWLGPRNGDP